MPLSEQELRTLEQLEAQLAAEDPKFVSAMNSDPARRARRRRVAVISAVVVLGFGLVIAGVLTKLAWLGLAGAVVLAGGALYALQSPSTPELGAPGASRSLRPAARGTLLQRSMSQGSMSQGSMSGGASPLVGSSFGRPHAAAPRGTSPFMHRMEERWERRRRENQGW